MVRAGHAAKIWEAMNSTDHQRVALKALHGKACTDRSEIAALKHEFNVGQSLKHPNVIELREFNIARNVPYLVMEYFDGPNIKQMLRQEPEFVQEHLVDIMHKALRALGHVHQRGWVHRDVKPDNFLLKEDGDLRLIDFSIAEKIKRGLGKLFGGKSKVQGTMSYISPEQLRGESVDGRADIYGLGCMFFELVAGRVPYTGTNANDLLNKHIKAVVPSLAAMNNEVTPEFAKLVAEMMAKRPDERPDSIEDIESALDGMRVLRRPTT
jgi:serine/threonine protein kinase